MQDGTFRPVRGCCIGLLVVLCASQATQDVNCAKRGNYHKIFFQILFSENRMLALVFRVEPIIFNKGTWFVLSYFRKMLRKCCCLLSVVFTPFIPPFCNTMNQLEAAGIPTEITALFFQSSWWTKDNFVLCVPPLSRYDGNSLLSSIECYDPVIDSWEVVTSMATQRCDAGVCVLREKWFFMSPLAKNGKSWIKQKDWQLDFALKKTNHWIRATKRAHAGMQEGLCQGAVDLMPLKHGQHATRDWVWNEAPEESITTCMTLFDVAVLVTYEIIFSVCPQSAIHFYWLWHIYKRERERERELV